MHIILLLLGLLRRSSMHGYQLMDFIEHNLSTCTDLKKPTAYLALERLAKRGLINEQEVREGRRPPRKVYTITPEGEAEFTRLLALNLSTYTPSKFPQDLGLAFADALPPDQVVQLLEQRRVMLGEELEAARRTPPHPGTLQLLVEHSIVHLESELEWLDKVIAHLARPAPAGRTDAWRTGSPG
ncbi:MAG: helix-turn-helix transcriptional regulator [Chloroflexota bacterium]